MYNGIRLLSNLVRLTLLLENNEIRLKSDGSPQRDFIHGDDVVRAIEMLISYNNKGNNNKFIEKNKLMDI